MAATQDAKPVETVGARAARGALWTLFFSVLGKGVAFGSQIALAWFLLPEHFGLAAMTLSITALASVASSTGLKNILIQRGHRFAEDAGQVFWLSLSLGLAAMAVLAIASVPAGRLFGEARVIPLILLVALAAPLQALQTVYSAALNRTLRFREIALIHLGGGTIQSGLAVLLAWTGFGAYALILPILGLAAFLAISYRLVAGPIALGGPRPSLWKGLVAPMGWLMANSLFLGLQTYGANLVIGAFERNTVISGYYFWGYAVASQAVFLLGTNLQGVLFPVLSKLNGEPERQFEGLRQACSVLSAIVIPLCLLQAVLAPKVITLVFHERWAPAIVVVQWLSVGLCLQPLTTLVTSVLLARGAFRKLALANAVLAGAVAVATVVGATVGQQAEIAIWVSAILLAANLGFGVVGYREFGRSCGDLLHTLLAPLGIGAAMTLCGWQAERLLRTSNGFVDLGLLAIVCSAAYAALLRLLLPEATRGLFARLAQRSRREPAPQQPALPQHVA